PVPSAERQSLVGNLPAFPELFDGLLQHSRARIEGCDIGTHGIFSRTKPEHADKSLIAGDDGAVRRCQIVTRRGVLEDRIAPLFLLEYRRFDMFPPSRSGLPFWQRDRRDIDAFLRVCSGGGYASFCSAFSVSILNGRRKRIFWHSPPWKGVGTDASIGYYIKLYSIMDIFLRYYF